MSLQRSYIVTTESTTLNRKETTKFDGGLVTTRWNILRLDPEYR